MSDLGNVPDGQDSGGSDDCPVAPVAWRRRGFLEIFIQSSLGALLISAVSCVLVYLHPASKSGSAGDSSVDAGAEDDLPVGQATVVQYKTGPVMVIRTADRLVALSATCTHLGCIVGWDEDRGQLVCPCHAAIFDLDGNVVAGPPPKPLPQVPVSVKDGHVMVGGGAA